MGKHTRTADVATGMIPAQPGPIPMGDLVRFAQQRLAEPDAPTAETAVLDQPTRRSWLRRLTWVGQHRRGRA